MTRERRHAIVNWVYGIGMTIAALGFLSTFLPR